MSKVHVCLTAEYSLVDEARRKRVNMSSLFEDSLREVLQMEEIRDQTGQYSENAQKLLAVITDEDLKKCAAAIQKSFQFSKGWKKIFENKYNIKLSRDDIIEVFGRKFEEPKP